MSWPKNWVAPNGDNIAVGSEHEASFHKPEEFLEIIRTTESLAALKKSYPATRQQLIRTMKHFGFDFMALLHEQMRGGKTNTELAALHAVDAKWIAATRAELGIPSKRGRPTRRVTDRELIAAYTKHGSYTGAAHELGMDRRTFGSRYRAVAERKPKQARY